MIFSKATAALQNLAKDSITATELTAVYDCLAILTMYGQDKRWEPLRRSDWLSIRYRGPNTDLTKENFLSTDGSIVVLTLNYGAKVQELKQAVEINISQCCPRLAKILLVLRPHVAHTNQCSQELVGTDQHRTNVRGSNNHGAKEYSGHLIDQL